MEPENLQSVLQEAGIQVDMKNLQNPTEDFMIYLIIEYLNKFHFDGNEISKSTTDQLHCVYCIDSASDAIRVINLYSSLSTICNEIFLKDLCLTDITSPGPKRARKQIKILFNFFAYVRNKMVENEMAFIELDNQQKYMETMIIKKDSIIVKIGVTLNSQENKMEIKQELQQEIKKIGLHIDDNNRKCKESEYRVKEVMMQYQDAHKKCNDLKANAIKLHKVTKELQSKIVKSPEEYAARSTELKKVLESKIEERQVLNDSITRKKLQIKNNENAQELVKNLNDKILINTNEICKQLKETSEKLSYVQKELNLLKIDFAKWKKIEINNSAVILNSKDVKIYDQIFFELNTHYIDIKSEFYIQKNLLEEMRANIIKKKNVLEDGSKTILTIQKDNSDLMKQYIEHFQNEILQEFTLRQIIVNTILK